MLEAGEREAGAAQRPTFPSDHGHPKKHCAEKSNLAGHLYCCLPTQLAAPSEVPPAAALPASCIRDNTTQPFTFSKWFLQIS